MVEIGSGAEKTVETVFLSRYACYLIVQNSDPTKVVVAKGQTYFAIQTHRQETADNLVEDNKRVFLREEIKKHNTSLTKTAKSAGVQNYAIFQNAGYKGLYGGLTMQDIHKRKKLSKSQQILDHMNSEELAANLFRATQTDAKIRREILQTLLCNPIISITKTRWNFVHLHLRVLSLINRLKKTGKTRPNHQLQPKLHGLGISV